MVQGEAPPLIYPPASMFGTPTRREPRSMCRCQVLRAAIRHQRLDQFPKPIMSRWLTTLQALDLAADYSLATSNGADQGSA